MTCLAGRDRSVPYQAGPGKGRNLEAQDGVLRRVGFWLVGTGQVAAPDDVPRRRDQGPGRRKGKVLVGTDVVLHVLRQRVVRVAARRVVKLICREGRGKRYENQDDERESTQLREPVLTEASESMRCPAALHECPAVQDSYSATAGKRSKFRRLLIVARRSDGPRTDSFVPRHREA